MQATIPTVSKAPTVATAATASEATIRQHLDVYGRVQGVGFRPFVYRLATEQGLGGYVSNDPRGVVIEVEGSSASLEGFLARLRSELPPLARIVAISSRPMPPAHEQQFRIMASSHAGEQQAEVTPDVTVCEDCLRELFDPGDRRYRYPFINCTNCGPRYSIIQGVPYDRATTTMATFTMCPSCQAEYDDPLNRRFHAQPNACPSCGPRVWFTTRTGQIMEGDPIRTCAAHLRRGAIVAIKGLGGFHLACRADHQRVVRELRTRKGRESKPLALMVGSLEAARRLARITDEAEAALNSPARPIVLVPRVRSAKICHEVAPGSDLLGIMLPYTPLHHLLFAEDLGPLVMTSGNPSDEPLCCENEEAIERLSTIADAFLLHDRGIERRVDDSVVMAIDKPLTRVIPIRRARGYVPTPLRIEGQASEPILAVGGELKSALCLLWGHDAVLSEHLGDLSNAAAYRHFTRTVECFQRFLRLDPRFIAYDLHPEYAATRYALRSDLPTIGVQHHHAHIVSCMADNRLSGHVIGLACDGTGYGSDGAIWGCEVLKCDEASFQRVAHLRYFPLIGGDAGARETWRPAAGLLHETLGDSWPKAAATAFQGVQRQAMELAIRLLSNSSRVVRTSSLGRLFDGVAALLGVCHQNRHEAQAAMTLEALAAKAPPCNPLDYDIQKATVPWLLDPRPAIRSLLSRLAAGDGVVDLARAFHETVAAMLAEAAAQAARTARLDRVVLSGGCFANRILLERVAERLRRSGLRVFFHQQVPSGDGGIALGQAVAAAERIRRSNCVSGSTGTSDCGAG